ncbi:hypothetical protein NDU88_000203, partial [Pleurodeles waltl]
IWTCLCDEGSGIWTCLQNGGVSALESRAYLFRRGKAEAWLHTGQQDVALREGAVPLR